MKKLLAVVAVVSMAAGSVFATQTRLGGLGIQNWMIEEDDNLIWLNPARVGNYSKTIWGEIGNDVAAVGAAPTLANQWGGITAECPIVDGNVLGVFAGRPYGGLVGTIGANAGGSDVTAIPALTTVGNAFGALAPVNKFDLMYSMKLGDMRLGAALNMASNSSLNEGELVSAPAKVALTDGSMKDSQSSADTNITIGAIMKDIAVIEKLDVVLNYGMPSLANKSEIRTWDGAKMIPVEDWDFKSDGASSLALLARAAMSVKNSKLLAILGYASNDTSSVFSHQIDGNGNGVYTDAADTNRKYTRKATLSQINVGGSLNTKISDKALLITALSVAQTTQKIDAKREDLRTASLGTDQEYNWQQTTFNMPLNIGLEYKIAKPVVGRLGVSRSIFNTQTTETNDPDYGAHNGTTYPLATTTTGKGIVDLQAAGATAVTMGVGVQALKDLYVDAIVRQQILYTDTWVLSGVAVKPVTQITATYKF